MTSCNGLDFDQVGASRNNLENYSKRITHVVRLYRSIPIRVAYAISIARVNKRSLMQVVQQWNA